MSKIRTKRALVVLRDGTVGEVVGGTVGPGRIVEVELQDENGKKFVIEGVITNILEEAEYI